MHIRHDTCIYGGYSSIGAMENRGSMYTHVGNAREYKGSMFMENIYAKLGSVVFYGNTLPNCNVQSVNHGRQQQEESSAL